MSKTPSNHFKFSKNFQFTTNLKFKNSIKECANTQANTPLIKSKTPQNIIRTLSYPVEPSINS